MPNWESEFNTRRRKPMEVFKKEINNQIFEK